MVQQVGYKLRTYIYQLHTTEISFQLL